MGGLFTALALVIVAYWFFRSPVCSAVSDSIRRHGGVGYGDGTGVDPEALERLEESVERLVEEVARLRSDLVELAERVDFSERMLIELRERPALPASRG